MQITGEMVTLFVVILGAVFGVWWRIESRIREAEAKAGTVAEDLSKFRIEVAQNHPSHSHLKDVEMRLVSAIDRLATQLDTMPDRLARIVKEALAGDR